MRRLAAVAFFILAAELPVCAQHGGHAGGGGGSHSGFSGHAASSMSNSSSRPSAPRAFAPSSRYAGNAPAGTRPGYRGAYGPRPAYSSANRGNPAYRSNGGRQPPYRRPYRQGFVPGFAYGGIYVGDYLGYPLGYADDGGYDVSTSASNDDSNAYAGYDAPPAGPDEDGANAPDPPYYQQPAIQRPSPAPQTLDAVTLVFKDGRPQEHIHNYILSRTTLSVLDSGPGERHRDIPVDQIDLAATEKANRDAGVSFHLPGAAR